MDCVGDPLLPDAHLMRRSGREGAQSRVRQERALAVSYIELRSKQRQTNVNRSQERGVLTRQSDCGRAGAIAHACALVMRGIVVRSVRSRHR